MNQRNLFDHEPSQVGHYGYPIARQTDPVTSQIAATEAATKAGRIHQTIAEWLSKQGEPLTAREIAEGVKRDCGEKCEVETIRKRVGELEDLQLDYRVGIAGVRKCKVTGKLAETWEVIK